MSAFNSLLTKVSFNATGSVTIEYPTGRVATLNTKNPLFQKKDSFHILYLNIFFLRNNNNFSRKSSAFLWKYYEKYDFDKID
jgi:hypothetical protein